METKIFDKHIFVCTNERKSSDKKSCGEEHGLNLVAAFKKQLNDKKLNLSIRAQRAGCLGICDLGPTVAVYPEGTFYVNVQLSDVQEIIESHIINNVPVSRLILDPKKWKS
jgi:(2Fe-2S) ferredoxin